MNEGHNPKSYSPAEASASPSRSDTDASTRSGPPRPHTDQKGSVEFNVMFFLKAAFKHRRIMILAVILGVLCGFVYIQKARRIYKAESVVEMNVRRPRVTNIETVYEETGARDSDAIFNTRFEKFKSPAMEKLAVEEFLKRFPKASSSENPGGIGEEDLPELIRDVDWRRDSDANIVRVSYRSEDPQFAANLVNILSDCAGLLMRQENQALSDEAVQWLTSQVEEQRESLEELEKQLAEIRKNVRLDVLEQQKKALGEAMASVSEERESLISRKAERKTIYDFLSSLHDADANLEVLPAGLPKEEQLNDMIVAWRSAHDEFQLVSGRYTKVHPAYRAAEEKESRARKRLEQFIDISSKSVQNEMDLLTRQIGEMTDRVEAMKAESEQLEQDLASGQLKVQGLERKRDAADNAFQMMLRRMEEARAAADENMAFTKVIRYAEVPVVPESPDKPTALALSVFIAGFLGLVVAVVVELWTDTIGSVSDLRAMDLNILGVIPTQKTEDSRGELATVGLRDKFNCLVEIFAGINALLSSDRYSDYSRVLLMCSALPAEGKTIATCNLAISSALNGSRTLLIEGDLRRPQLLNIFSMDENHPSLLDWLVDGNSTLSHSELVCANVIENLDIIPSKPLADINPAELLGRDRLAALLAWAREHYDRVIIDSPPMGPVGDGQVLANLSDGVILVSRIGKTRRRLLKFALNRLAEIDAPVLGCIANDVPNSLAGMFSGAEGYGYGYGYGYKPYKNNQA